MDQQTKAHFDNTRKLALRLARLLEDPQPGILSWTSLYCEVMKELVTIWKTESEPKKEIEA